MSLTKEFIEAVDNDKKTRVRIMLKDIMLVDPSLKKFDEMLNYAEKNMPDLYDLHDGEKFSDDSSTWNEDYMNEQMVAVVTNFSRERLSFLGKIVKKLYAYKIHTEKAESISYSDNSSRRESVAGGVTGVQIAGGVVAVAGAGVLIGGIAGSNVPVAIVGGVALAGGIAMIALGGNREI